MGGGRSWSPEECGKVGDDVSSEASRDGHVAAGDGRLFSDEENGSPRFVHPSVESMLESAVKRDVQVEASKAARDLDSLKREELLNLQVTSGHVASLGQSADVREEEVDRCISWEGDKRQDCLAAQMGEKGEPHALLVGECVDSSGVHLDREEGLVVGERNALQTG